jgi:hypothetical protein
VIGIFLVLVAGVVGDDGVHLEQPEEKDQPRADLDLLIFVDVVILVAEREGLFAAQCLRYGLIVEPALKDPMAVRPGRTSLRSAAINRNADEVAGVALVDEFCTVPAENNAISSECAWTAASTLPLWGFPGWFRSMTKSFA